MDGFNQAEDTWTVAGRTFRSRLIVGTGKYKDYAQNAAAAEAAGAEIVTVALRRVNLSDPSQPMLVDYVKPDRFTFLPNTAGCFTGEAFGYALQPANSEAERPRNQKRNAEREHGRAERNLQHLIPDMRVHAVRNQTLIQRDQGDCNQRECGKQQPSKKRAGHG